MWDGRTYSTSTNQRYDKFQDVDYKVILVTNGYKLEEVVPHLGKIRPRVSLYEPMELPDIDMDVIRHTTEEGENVNFNQRSYVGIKKPCYLPSYNVSRYDWRNPTM